MTPRMCIVLGALTASLAVAIGAFGAHWLSSQAPKWYYEPEVSARMQSNWEVGVRYQIYAAMGLILVGLWASRVPERSSSLPAWLLLTGALIFSGCLYALVISGERVLGAIVPIGGGLMIAGWLTFAVSAWRMK